MKARAEKICVACGRRIEWRKKWERDWANVTYCSRSCRVRRDDPMIARLEAAILELLESRVRTSSICPSEAARAVDPDSWSTLMELTRRAARRLVASGDVEITQRGRVVDPSTARGPIRIRRRDGARRTRS